MSKSLGLLICDTPIPSVVLSHGDYHSIFSTLLASSLSDKSIQFTVDPYDVKKQEYPSEDKQYDAFMITGSAASAYENLEWINRLITFVASIPDKYPKAKIFGICFGHQVVGRAFGGECVPNGGRWEVGVTEVDLTDVGREIFGVQKLNIHQMHRDHVPAVPAGFTLLGSTPVAHNQGMVQYASEEGRHGLTDIRILTVQGHPEFTKPIVNAIVEARSKSGVIGESTVEDYRKREDWRNDGVSVIGKVFWKILGVDSG
ncbi:hypothetical protein CCMSSC00406_0006904 [Pleurotus cornucopiae]|uniref:Uncharacterized protein n=1 Tax=Pleurotus cornucopiae TaxID=5321 RepID=A0ACB7IQU3_PLECO|nr:hypothetical protein CCMSSC00406_0006904 [Pleurotus cornucopiae]